MLHINHPQELQNWAPMDPPDTQTLGLESDLMEEELYGSHLGLNDFDLSSSQLLSPELCPEFDLAMGETASELYHTSQTMGVTNALDAPRLADKITSMCVFMESIAPHPRPHGVT